MSDPELDLQRLFDAAPGCYLVLAPDIPRFTILAATDAYLAAMKTRRDYVLGKGVFEVFPDNPDDPARAADSARSSFRRVVELGRPDMVGIRKQDIRRPGSEGGGFEERYWDTANFPIFGADGKVAYILHRVENVTEAVRMIREEADLQPASLAPNDPRLALIRAVKTALEAREQAERISADLRREIAERTRLEQEVKKRQVELQSLFNNSNAGLVLFNAKPPFTVLAHNKYYQELFAEPFRTQGVVGKNIYEYAPAVEAEGIMAVFDEVLRTKEAVNLLDFRYDSHPPEKSWFNWHLSPIIQEGEVVALASMSINVTQQHMAEQAQRESEQRFRSVLDTSVDVIYRVNLETGRFEYVSPSSERIVGFTPDELMAQSAEAALAMVHPEDLPGMRESLARVNESGEAEMEYRQRTKSGDYIWVSNHVSIACDPAGRPVYRVGNIRDITARERAEEALKDSEARYRLVFETANEGIWVTDGTWKTVLVNQRMADMLGYSVDELLGRVPAEFLQADQEPTVLKARGDLAAGATINREFKFRRKDGSDLWVISSASPVKDPEGRLIHTVSMLTDITERKAAEEAIRASEAKLRGVLNATQESIWVFDPDGIVLLANAVGLARMRREARDIIGKRMMEVLPQDLGRSRMERLREVVRSARPVEFEDERAGLLFHHSFCPALDSAGRVMFVVSFSRDITERKKTEALQLALAEQDRVRLGAAVEQASDSVVIFDLDGTIRYVNAAFESLNRLPRDEAVGHSYFDLLAGDPSAAALREAIGQGLAWHGPLIRTLPEGRTIELEVMYSPAKDPAGATVGGLVTEADVTQRNALQQQIRQAQKMEALGTLAGGITHDFNNILGTIVINTELALLDLDPSDPARSPLPVVLQAANRGKELVKQIITFSRQRAWERKPVEIAPVVREGLGLLRSTLPKDIVFRETIDDGSGIVLADPSHIHQILVNLCQNAALAMRDRGERQLEVELEPVEADAAMAVRHPDLKPGPYVRLTVADTGCGMTPEIMERIFEPFYTTRERGSGSGLGLSVVHGIVKSYSGAITVRSRPGQGSVFDIYLPRLGEDVPAVGAEPAPQPVRGRARILVVEDEEAQRTSLARGLERLGYGVTAEPDGRSALAAFRKDPGAFDLVITDQIMPRMSGLELAAELMEVRPDLPVILCTGFSEKVNSGTVETSGIRELAMKPFTITEISQLIRKVLGKENGAG